MTMAEAIREALREEMRRDERVILLGEDIGVFGGPFGVTRGLLEEFGPERVRETPISEAAFLGAAVGCAMMGFRPVVEISFVDFIAVCFDQLAHQASKAHFVSGGRIKTPLVVRTSVGGGWGLGFGHSQCLESWFLHTPGILVAFPSTPADAKGLLKAAIRTDEPVVFLEHKLLYGFEDHVPEGDLLGEFGKAAVRAEGEDVTIVAAGYMVHKALNVRRALEGKASVEVIDPRTLHPLDEETILRSIRKTGRLVVVHEDYKRCGFGAELVALVAERAFDLLKSPPRRVAVPDIPIPASPHLERAAIPAEEEIERAIREILR